MGYMICAQTPPNDIICARGHGGLVRQRMLEGDKPQRIFKIKAVEAAEVGKILVDQVTMELPVSVTNWRSATPFTIHLKFDEYIRRNGPEEDHALFTERVNKLLAEAKKNAESTVE